MRDVVLGDLDERVVTMEMLDDYLSATIEQVHIVGRVQEWDGGAGCTLRTGQGRGVGTRVHRCCATAGAAR